MGKFIISRVIFHSYLKLPEGILVDDRRLVFTSDKCDKLGFARLDNYFLNL
jgi:hypothetical protein